MKQLRSEAGFSLVELLAVVLILSVLAAVAVPLYLSTRREAAARTCEANIAAIAAAESAWALRHGSYSTTSASTDLVGASEGLTAWPTCPLTGNATDYTVSGTDDITISCGNKAVHATDVGLDATDTANWAKELKAPTAGQYLPGTPTASGN